MNREIFPDIGYTPDNLRAILREMNISMAKMAEYMGVSLTTVQCWCAAPTAQYFKSMGHLKWLEVLDIYQRFLESQD